MAREKIPTPSPEKLALQNLYRLVCYHASKNRARANDLVRKETAPDLQCRDEGLADAYEYIELLLQRPELLKSMDCESIINTELPHWLKAD